MRILFTLLTAILAWLLIASSTTVASDTVDVTRIASAIAPLQADQIATALQAPVPDDALPPAFNDASPLKQEDEAPYMAAGAAASVSYSMTYTPDTEPTPEAASPRPSGPGRTFNTASITYLVFEEELTTDMLADFDEIFLATVSDQDATAETQEITIADQPAWLISIETEINGIPILIDWVAVPVGKVAVLSMTMSGGTAVDRESLLADAEALSLAAITHLGTAIDQRGTLAG